MKENPKNTALICEQSKEKNKDGYQAIQSEEAYENNPKKICTILIDQYKSVFKVRNKESMNDEILISQMRIPSKISISLKIT